MPKINYGIRENKKGEVRPSMLQAFEANQVRYWGMHKVDSRMLQNYRIRKPRAKVNKSSLLLEIMELKGKITNLKKQIEATKNSSKKEELTAKRKALVDKANALVRQYQELNQEPQIDKALTKASKHKFVPDDSRAAPKKRGRPRKS